MMARLEDYGPTMSMIDCWQFAGPNDGEVYNETVYFINGIEEGSNETNIDFVQQQLNAGANPAIALAYIHVAAHQLLGAIYSYRQALLWALSLIGLTTCKRSRIRPALSLPLHGLKPGAILWVYEHTVTSRTCNVMQAQMEQRTICSISNQSHQIV